jgi:hypothetical protein
MNDIMDDKRLRLKLGLRLRLKLSLRLMLTLLVYTLNILFIEVWLKKDFHYFLLLSITQKFKFLKK